MADTPATTQATGAAGKSTGTTRRTRVSTAKPAETTPALSPERQDPYQAAQRIWPD
jgi:hypothetical protein